MEIIVSPWHTSTQQYFDVNDIVNKKKYERKVRFGYSRMKEYSVVFCAIARNCAKNLCNTLLTIDEIGKRFKEYNIVVIENDSKDDTKKILNSWPTVKVFNYTFNFPFFPGGSRSILRVFMLANIRSMYLNYIDFKCKDVDYVIVVDLDIKIEPDGIAHSFSYKNFDGIAANGRDINSHLIGYDCYAFLTDDDYKNPFLLPQKRTISNIKELTSMKIGEPLFKCRSAFGGLCIYNRKSIYGLRYSSPMVHYSEHAGLHESMWLRGHDKFYINPSMVVWRL